MFPVKHLGRDAAAGAGCPVRRGPGRRHQPNPRQPRSVFDEEDMAELVHSVREIGVLQPVVVRPIERRAGPVRAHHGRAALAGEPGRRPADGAGDHPRDGRRRPAAGRAAGEPAPQPAEPARGGRGLQPAARGLRLHARGAGRPDRPLAPADLQHAAPAEAAAAGAAAGRGRRARPPATPARCSACRTAPRSSGWPSGSSPRACRSARSRRSSRWAATTSRRPEPSDRAPARGTASWTSSPTGSPTASTPGCRSRWDGARAGSASSSPASRT